MQRKVGFERTMIACYIGYITQAIANVFAPLLFLTFSRQYGIALSKIALISTINFAIQLTVDLAAAKFGEYSLLPSDLPALLPRLLCRR